MYMSTFRETLKPKFHYTTHYPTLIKRYGPLYYISSMKYEAKHKMLKNYCKNNSCRKNLSLSLALKLEYNFVGRIFSGIGLNDSVSTGTSKLIDLSHPDYFLRFETSASAQLQNLLKANTKETNHVVINGIKFSTKLLIAKRESSKLELFRILNIVHVTENVSDIFLYASSITMFTSMKIIRATK